jgi:hypothetical protein
MARSAFVDGAVLGGVTPAGASANTPAAPTAMPAASPL